MLALTTQQQEALARRVVMRRQFVWIEARTELGAPDPVGFWNDIGVVTHAARTYHGSGTLMGVSSLSAKGNLTIPGLTIIFNGIDAVVAAQVRGRVIAQVPMEYSIGLFNPDTGEVLPPLIRRFIGFVDDCVIRTPKAGDTATIELTCESTSRALTVQSTNTRSESTMKQRSATDTFYKYTGVQRKPLYFGKADPRPKSTGTGIGVTNADN